MGELGAVRLDWNGKEMPALAGLTELCLVSPGDPACRLIHGDNLAAMRALGRRAMSFMLAYLDPPFLTGRLHLRVTRARHTGTGGIVRSLGPAFDDRWSGLAEYLSELRPRLVAARDLLDDRGCMVLHVDTKTSHYAKVLCDEIFGQSCFASEIVWRYRRWPSKTANFQRVHDVLLRYVKNPRTAPRFRQLYEPLAPSTQATWGNGRQRAVFDGQGRRKRSSTTETESPGTPLGDVWNIGIVAPVARERTGYPTQKPEALIERLLQACTEPGDLVLDPYVGSGTTLSVCHRLGRAALGIDASPGAVEVTLRRLEAAGVVPLLERARTAERPRRLGKTRGAEAADGQQRRGRGGQNQMVLRARAAAPKCSPT
ncbi:MAG: site-specific DNA-methyltransferase [Polyangiaceae bacterium]|nr:site-specific DNA-methyltransferase [Polyangiaceae bacterium]